MPGYTSFHEYVPLRTKQQIIYTDPKACAHQASTSPFCFNSPLFDMELGSPPCQHSHMIPVPPETRDPIVLDTSMDARPPVQLEHHCVKLRQHVEASLAGEHATGSSSLLEVARGLTEIGYHVSVIQERSKYSRHKGRPSTIPFHPFLLVTGHTDVITSEHSDLHLIVDPGFRDKFIVSNPSPKLDAQVSSLDRCFVGNVEDIRNLVSSLAASLRAEFAQKGLSLPPWRSSSSLLSVWLPLDGRRHMRMAPTSCLKLFEP